MTEVVRAFIARVARVLDPPGPVYEFGSLQVQGPELSDMRLFFPGRDYVGMDLVPGRGVDALGDVRDLTLPNLSVGTVLCLETLEHVDQPWRALREMTRVLKRNGVLIMSMPFWHPIHHEPDYWRFTPAGMRAFLETWFPRVWVRGLGGRADRPAAVGGVAVWNGGPDLGRLAGVQWP